MKLRTLATAALAALTLAACSKDGEKGGGNNEGEDTSFQFAITLPTVTRADATQQGNAIESKIGDEIYIYVFNPDGALADGDAYKKFSLASDFTLSSGGVYLLKESNKMTTKAGDRVVYVIANLESSAIPAAITTGTITNESALLATVDVQDDLLNGDPLESIVMLGRTAAKLAVADYDNVVEVELERSVAKVIATLDTDETDFDFKADWGGNTDALNIKVKEFFLVQDAHTSYFAQAYNSQGYRTSYISTASSWADAINTYDSYYNVTPDNTPHYESIVVDNTSGRANIAGFYIGENVASNENDVARYGSATYAFFKTELSLTKSAKANSAGDDIEYEGAPIAAGDGFRLIRIRGAVEYDDLIIEDDDDVEDDVVAVLVNEEGIDVADIFVYSFPESYVYYRVFLNKDQAGVEKYNVYRNQFIHLLITGINITDGEFGKGYPGDEGNPEIPIDPNNPDEGENPNPPGEGGGGEPLDPKEDATLRVRVSVKNWQYKPGNVDLGGDEK